VGVLRGQKTPMQYARDVVDPAMGTSFSQFMNIYLKKKYAKQPLNPAERQYVYEFLKPFIKTVRKKVSFKKRFAGFINPLRSIGFFVMPEDEKEA